MPLVAHDAVALFGDDERVVALCSTAPAWLRRAGGAPEALRREGVLLAAAHGPTRCSAVVLGAERTVPREHAERLLALVAARLHHLRHHADPRELLLAHAAETERTQVAFDLGGRYETVLTALAALLADADADAGRARTAVDAASRALLAARAAPTWAGGRDEPLADAFLRARDDVALVLRAAGVRLDAELVAPRDARAGSAARAAAAITRAAALNTARHAGATRLRLAWWLSAEGLHIAVADDGRGFTPGAAPPGRRGLRRARACAAAAGGRLVVDAVPGWGTRVQATLPLERAAPVDADAARRLATLGERELEVLRLLVAGQRNRQIAESLVVSAHTVKFHVTNILRKLDVRSRAEAVALAHAAGLFGPERGA